MTEMQIKAITTEIESLIDRKVRFTSSAHPGLTPEDVASRLKKYDLEIAELQAQLDAITNEAV